MDSLKNMIVANGRIHAVFRPSKIDLSLIYATFTPNGAKLVFCKFLRRKPVTKKPLLFERNGLFIFIYRIFL